MTGSQGPDSLQELLLKWKHISLSDAAVLSRSLLAIQSDLQSAIAACARDGDQEFIKFMTNRFKRFKSEQVNSIAHRVLRLVFNYLTSNKEVDVDVLRGRMRNLSRTVFEFSVLESDGPDATQHAMLQRLAGLLLLDATGIFKESGSSISGLLLCLSQFYVIVDVDGPRKGTGFQIRLPEDLSPDLTVSARVLQYASELQLPPSQYLVNGPAMLLVIRELAGSLLPAEPPHNDSPLHSPAYRRILWRSMEKVSWHEALKMLYCRITDRECPDHGDMDTLEAAFWLVCELGYNAFGVDRRLRIFDHFRKARTVEGLLYQEFPEYRDHLVHALNTFLTGWLLLTARNSPLPWAVADPPSESDKHLLRNWFVAALCHDHGYAMKLYPGLQPVVENFGSVHISEAVRELNDVWTRHVLKMNTAARNQGPLTCDPGASFDHGIVSYLHTRRFLALADSMFGDSPAANDFNGSALTAKYAMATRAILVHNVFRQEIETAHEPLSATLVLCDELQEWLRPRHDHDELTREIFSLINFRAFETVTPRNTCCNPVFPDVSVLNGRARFKENAPVRIQLVYRDPNENSYEPLSNLLAKIFNFERITGLESVKLSLELYIPRLEQNRSPSFSEFDILRDFCLLREQSFCSSEVYNPASTGNVTEKRCCLTLAEQLVPGGPVYDRLTLNLDKFASQPESNRLVRKAPWQFQSDLWEFKRAWCKKHDIKCVFLEPQDDWPLEYIG